MAIPEEFLEELVARSDIVDTVSSYVTLNKKGANYWGLCPFHNEKTPSFSVAPDKQIYYCFGCHKGGGVISFIMEMEGLPFPDAVRLLAQRAGLEVPETAEDRDGARRRERLLALNREAARWFHDRLAAPAAAQAADYLRRRALSPKTVTRFGLGFAPDEWDGLIRAMTQQGFTKAELLEAGLVVKNQNGRIYDRFRNRVMFPIIDIRGEVIGFGGRVMNDSTPKYLNSPDTPVFNKSRNLFALNLAKKSRQGRIILTEGYMDTISLHQAGFDCAVASLGTSLTQEHAQLLSRYTKEAVIAYDGDGAGVAAAQRAITILEKTGLRVRVLQMQGAKDPDEFIKKFGREAFAALLEQSENHITYRLLQVQRKYDLTLDEQKRDYLQEAADLIAALDSPVEREIYGGRAAAAADFSADAMSREVERRRKQKTWKARRQQERRELTPARQRQPEQRALRYEDISSGVAEQGIIQLLLADPALLDQADGLEPEHFSSPLLGRIFSLLRQRHQEGRGVPLAALEESLSAEEMSHLSAILQRPQSLPHGRQALGDYINRIQTRRARGTDDAALLAYREKKGHGGNIS